MLQINVNQQKLTEAIHFQKLFLLSCHLLRASLNFVLSFMGTFATLLLLVPLGSTSIAPISGRERCDGGVRGSHAVKAFQYGLDSPLYYSNMEGAGASETSKKHQNLISCEKHVDCHVSPSKKGTSQCLLLLKF